MARSARQRREASEARRARRAEVTDADIVMQAAAALLASRPRSVDETRRRLVSLGYPPVLCDHVVARLVALGYLDDTAFAQTWVESRDRARPRGAVALRRELLRKGITEDTIAVVLAERSGPLSTPVTAQNADLAAARRLLERRAATLRREADPRRRRQKAYALLARNGFDPDICRELASSVFGSDDDGPDSDV